MLEPWPAQHLGGCPLTATATLLSRPWKQSEPSPYSSMTFLPRAILEILGMCLTS